MSRRIKLIIATIIGISIIGGGLYFLINRNNKDLDSVINSKDDNNDSSKNVGELVSEKEEESTKAEDNSTVSNSDISENNNSSVSNNTTTNSNTSNNISTDNNINNSSTNNTVETNPEIVESTFTSKILKTSEGIDLKYWLYTPKNPVANMPLIVYLHGGSAKGDDINKVVEGSFPKFLKNGELGSINAYVVIPQVPSSYKGWSDIKISVYDLINNTKNKYGINQNKISLTGHSMGGKGTYDIALAYPSLFSCIAPMSGSITVNNININKLKKLPIWAFVGSNDTIVDPSTSTKFLNKIMNYNSQSKLTTFDGATHFDVPELGYKGTNVINWLISNSK